MTIETNPLLAKLRSDAVSVFLDAETWTVTRPGAYTVQAGREVPGATDLYTGPGRCVQAGGVIKGQLATLEFPRGAFVGEPGDVAECTVSADAQMVGVCYRITQDSPARSTSVLYRVVAERVTK